MGSACAGRRLFGGVCRGVFMLWIAGGALYCISVVVWGVSGGGVGSQSPASCVCLRPPFVYLSLCRLGSFLGTRLGGQGGWGRR